jgi:hypothetical protein
MLEAYARSRHRTYGLTPCSCHFYSSSALDNLVPQLGGNSLICKLLAFVCFYQPNASQFSRQIHSDSRKNPPDQFLCSGSGYDDCTGEENYIDTTLSSIFNQLTTGKTM